jgi:hypothetical protein
MLDSKYKNYQKSALRVEISSVGRSSFCFMQISVFSRFFWLFDYLLMKVKYWLEVLFIMGAGDGRGYSCGFYCEMAR